MTGILHREQQLSYSPEGKTFVSITCRSGTVPVSTLASSSVKSVRGALAAAVIEPRRLPGIPTKPELSKLVVMTSGY